MSSSINSYNTCSNAVFWHRHSPTIVLPLVYCTADNMSFELRQKSAVHVCKVATVVMETTQLVLCQFKNFLL